MQAVLVIAAAVLISLAATSSRSLWIDEACTAVRAMQPTLGSWWHAMEQEKTGCLQMPLYMLYSWGWAQLFGYGEWSLHLANLPWFVVGAAAFILSFPAGDRRRPLVGCLVLLCPFAWYYLDEARPYAMQLGATLLALASLRRIAQGCRLGGAQCAAQLALFLFAMVVLCGSGLFGTIWAGAAGAALVLLLSWKQLAELIRTHRWLWLAATGPLIGLAVYYAWTLKVGARGSSTDTTTTGSILFVGYELLGFAGLGPGRLAMRSMGPAALQGYWMGVALYALTVATLIGAAVWHGIKVGNLKHLAIALCCCLPPVLILGAGWVMHFRVLGRHLTPFVPALLLLLIFGASALWSHGTWWARAPVVVFCLLSLISCLSLRFAARHEKDDYRMAAALARTALRNGGPVWWSAAEEGAHYYGVPLATGLASNGEAIFMMDPARESLGVLPPPALIVASKPDVYDGQRVLADYIHERGYREVGRFPAFVIWERSPK